MSDSGKIRLGIIFGGRSSEHEVSVTSARSVVEAVDKDRYEIELYCILPDGKWVTGPGAAVLLSGKSAEFSENVLFPQYPEEEMLFSLTHDQHNRQVTEKKRPDVLFPVLHGTYGEDGTIQGLFELADIPYVGAGVAASSVGMDKVLMKDVFKSHRLPVSEYHVIMRHEWESDRSAQLDRLKSELKFPVFVKPSNAGSSVGISKVKTFDALAEAVDLAAKYDRKLIAEKAIDAREIECSVLGNDRPEASLPGEVIPKGEFYDYEAKYTEGGSDLVVPADLSDEMIRQVQEISCKAFTALDCAGMARVDFFLDKNSGKLYLNELNTIPGFTPVSMYPILWKATGLSYSELIDRLIKLAIERCNDRRKSITTK